MDARIIRAKIPEAGNIRAELPFGAQFLEVVVLGGAPHMLFKGVPDRPLEIRSFHLSGMADPCPIGCEYLGHFKVMGADKGRPTELIYYVWEQAERTPKLLAFDGDGEAEPKGALVP